MISRAFRYFIITFLLAGILVGIIFFGFYLNASLPEGAWYKTAAFFSLIFIWSVLLAITIYSAMKGVDQFKQITRKKLEYDFLAWMGYLIVMYNQSIDMDKMVDFYKMVFEDRGFEKFPELNKYFDESGELTVNREILFDKIRVDIDNILNGLNRG